MSRLWAPNLASRETGEMGSSSPCDSCSILRPGGEVPSFLLLDPSKKGSNMARGIIPESEDFSLVYFCSYPREPGSQAPQCPTFLFVLCAEGLHT